MAQSDMAAYMDSLVAPLSIINAIIVEITSRKEKEITERFTRLEKVWDEYQVYENDEIDYIDDSIKIHYAKLEGMSNE